uniref:Uncharacterized protein n=1 Tax=Panagrolaimus sp. PS1159 TaxID=55785 RepID=A0AC35GM49_9BILA
MSNGNNSGAGRQTEDDNARAIFNALDPAIQNLLLQEARRRDDASNPPPYDDWDFQPMPSTSRGNIQPPSTRGNFEYSAPRGNFQDSSSRGNFHVST